ncbi:hypothetical protein BTJ45_01154 [Bacillus mycoides]|nr:hypothetical protein BTJ45_01154 [Bacillus mycoides]
MKSMQLAVTAVMSLKVIVNAVILVTSIHVVVIADVALFHVGALDKKTAIVYLFLLNLLNHLSFQKSH